MLAQKDLYSQYKLHWLLNKITSKKHELQTLKHRHSLILLKHFNVQLLNELDTVHEMARPDLNSTISLGTTTSHHHKY